MFDSEWGRQTPQQKLEEHYHSLLETKEYLENELRKTEEWMVNLRNSIHRANGDIEQYRQMIEKLNAL